jgi:uncharacterized protein
MKRLITSGILTDLDSKIVLLSGPRQVGKTTLAQSLCPEYTYLNYDIPEHRKIISRKSWVKDAPLLILDELHKMPKWKSFLKGVFDLDKSKKGTEQKIIVTGSSRLDISRKMGDSLAGRHFMYRLNPLTPKELHFAGEDISLQEILKYSGFPEPLLKKDLTFYKRWQGAHLDIILRQDLLDLEQVRNISQIELLVELLKDRVGSPCSYSSLAEDLQVSPATVKKWLTILENLYVVFRITPFHGNIGRSLLKAPKYYFYDIGRVPDSGGARFENLVALCIKSEVEYLKDTAGRKLELFYLRNKDKYEIDFLVRENKSNILMLEAKVSETTPDSSFRVFTKNEQFSCGTRVQLVQADTERQETQSGIKIESANEWLKRISL